jgi:hypothetical protein
MRLKTLRALRMRVWDGDSKAEPKSTHKYVKGMSREVVVAELQTLSLRWDAEARNATEDLGDGMRRSQPPNPGTADY